MNQIHKRKKSKFVLLIFPENSPIPLEPNFPLSIYTLGKYLEKQNIEVKYFDQRIDSLKKLDSLLQKKPIIVGLTAMTSYQLISAIKMSKIVKTKGIPVVWGGVHASIKPNQVIKKSYVDFIIKGEGEKTLYELVSKISEDQDLSKVKGLIWKKKEYNQFKIIHNKNRDCIEPSEIAFPYLNNPDLNKYTSSSSKKGIKSFYYESSRGCPYNCAFCYNESFNNRKCRLKSIEQVTNELKHMKHLGIDSLYFADDEVAYNKSRIKDICEVTKEIGIKWSGGIRVNNIDKESLIHLENSGCEYIFFGIESGNPETLKYINKQITVDQIKNCVKLLSNSRIVPTYSFMFGFPQEPKNHLKDTFKLIDWIIATDKKAEITLQIYSPIPGSKMYEIAKQNKFKDPTLEGWSKMVSHEVNTPWIKNKKFLENLYIISLLAFRHKNILGNSWLFYLPHKIAKLRWKKKYFSFGIERVLFDLLVKYQNLKKSFFKI